ncbi:GCN5 family acetyltransferase [Frondihabitans sp. PAMC 28766]|nr:GCN5 family acetyltransferase [Frondihabitans sp. PAMC 28766]
MRDSAASRHLRASIRDATPDDAERCREIYRPYIDDTAITFEEAVPSVDEMRRRIADAQAAHAWLVLEDGEAPDRRVIGYAYAGPFATRAAYRWAAEVSVYLARDERHRGGGRALYAALLPRLVDRGFRIAMACMTLPNEASVGLHEALGFERVATYRDIGWKLGSWHSTAWMQLWLPTGDSASAPPSELR